MNSGGQRLVVFGCGYLGTEVARQACGAGLKVQALTRNLARAEELAAVGVEVVVDDLAAATWRDRIAPGADFVLNCVGAGGGGADDYRRSYVEGTRSILDWARHGPIGTLVYTSSTAVYPQGGGQVVDETAPTEGAGETGGILLEAEALVARAKPAVCQRWFILRLAGIYGPGRHHLLDQMRAGANEITGTGGHRLNLAHRDDVCAAIWSAWAASGPAGIFNVADDLPAPKAEVMQWLAQRLGRTPPRFAGGPASRRRGFAEPLDRIISNARLKAELGWRPRYPSFREGYAAILSA